MAAATVFETNSQKRFIRLFLVVFIYVQESSNKSTHSS